MVAQGLLVGKKGSGLPIGLPVRMGGREYVVWGDGSVRHVKPDVTEGRLDA